MPRESRHSVREIIDIDIYFQKVVGGIASKRWSRENCKSQCFTIEPPFSERNHWHFLSKEKNSPICIWCNQSHLNEAQLKGTNANILKYWNFNSNFREKLGFFGGAVHQCIFRIHQYHPHQREEIMRLMCRALQKEHISPIFLFPCLLSQPDFKKNSSLLIFYFLGSFLNQISFLPVFYFLGCFLNMISSFQSVKLV